MKLGIAYVQRRPRAAVGIWLLVLLCVITGELLPGNSAPMALVSSAALSDKALHLSAYAVLAVLPTTVFHGSVALSFLVFTELVGIALEFGQLLIPERSCDLSDIAANTAGVLIGAAAALFVRSRTAESPDAAPRRATRSYTPVSSCDESPRMAAREPRIGEIRRG